MNYFFVWFYNKSNSLLVVLCQYFQTHDSFSLSISLSPVLAWQTDTRTHTHTNTYRTMSSPMGLYVQLRYPQLYRVITRKSFLGMFFQKVSGKIKLGTILLCYKSVLEIHTSTLAMPHYGQPTIFLSTTFLRVVFLLQLITYHCIRISGYCFKFLFHL